MIGRTSWGIATAGLVVLISGCGGGADKPLPKMVPAEGTVLFDGKPLPGATVFFHPQDPKLLDASGQTDETGHFTLMTMGSSGAVPGPYRVTVEHFTQTDGKPFTLTKADIEAGMDMQQYIAMGKVKPTLPKRYSSPQTTDAKVEVTAEGSTALAVNLTK